MTHLHAYNLPDLWANGADFRSGHDGIPGSVQLPTDLSDRVASVCREPVRLTRLLGGDYAETSHWSRGSHVVGRSRVEGPSDRSG